MTSASGPASALPAHTLDAFHRGRFFLVQPAEGGHRAGMDAMMLAAAVPSDFSGRLADFGAGAGAAGLAVLSRCAGATALLVERSAAMAEFARATLDHPSNHALGGRASVLQADVALAGKARVAAGLADNCVDYVIMNPPFNAEADRPTPKTLKREAHVMEASALADWMRSAAAVVRPRGGLAAIVRPEQIGAVLDALAGRFGSTEVKPIHARADAAAIRIVLRATRGARGKLVLRSPLFLHAPGSDRFSTEADAINNGLASLFGD